MRLNLIEGLCASITACSLFRLMNLYRHNKKHTHAIGTNISTSKPFKTAICNHSPEANNIIKHDFKSFAQASPRASGTAKRRVMLSNNR